MAEQDPLALGVGALALPYFAAHGHPPWPFLPHLLDTGSDWGSLTLAPGINYPQLSTCGVKRNEKLLGALEIWTNEFSMKSSPVN